MLFHYYQAYCLLLLLSMMLSKQGYQSLDSCPDRPAFVITSGTVSGIEKVEELKITHLSKQKNKLVSQNYFTENECYRVKSTNFGDLGWNNPRSPATHTWFAIYFSVFSLLLTESLGINIRFTHIHTIKIIAYKKVLAFPNIEINFS